MNGFKDVVRAGAQRSAARQQGGGQDEPADMVVLLQITVGRWDGRWVSGRARWRETFSRWVGGSQGQAKRIEGLSCCAAPSFGTHGRDARPLL